MKYLSHSIFTWLTAAAAAVGCSNTGSGNAVGPVSLRTAGASPGPGAGGVLAGVAAGVAATPAIGSAGQAPRVGAGSAGMTGASGNATVNAGARAGVPASASAGNGVSGAGAALPPVAGNGSAPAGSTATPAGASSAIEPILPAIMGECPEFKAGTSNVTVLGISATVIAGAQARGTGSLLFYFYGTGKLGDVSFLPQAIKDDITKQGGIVFAPDAAKNTGGDCSGTGTFGIDDFLVSDQVAACAVKNYGIDPKRIYATGCSAGGLTTGCMGIMRSNYIAAVAPNSGGVTIGYGKLQNPMHMPNAITMNGGASDNVIVNFGDTSEAYDNYVLKYGGFAVNCIHNSGHCGAPASVYQSAWQFLKDHPFGVQPEPYANGLPSGFDPVCKVFQMTSMAPLGGF